MALEDIRLSEESWVGGGILSGFTHPLCREQRIGIVEMDTNSWLLMAKQVRSSGGRKTRTQGQYRALWEC